MNARRVISKFEQVTHLSLFVLQTYLRKSHFALYRVSQQDRNFAKKKKFTKDIFSKVVCDFSSVVISCTLENSLIE